MKQTEKKLEYFDHLIKESKISVVRKELESLAYRDIPRPLKYKFAIIARRVNIHYWAIKLLNPIVRSEVPMHPPVSEHEIVNYAACLIRVGSLSEGFSLLESLDSERFPEILLFRSLGLITRWEYGNCIPLLKKYLQSTKITEYQRLVGEFNLASAYVFNNRYNIAKLHLKRITKVAKRKNLNLLLASSMELRAQVEISNSNYLQAREYLEEALKVFRAPGNIYAFFASKWNAIIDLDQHGPTQSRLKNLGQIREKAKRMGHWETLRECDLYQAKLTGDEELMNYLYFGTPYENYRNRILKMCPWDFSPKSHFNLGKNAQGISATEIDLRKGQSTDGKVRLKTGTLLHKCLVTMTQDFYRPCSLGALFSELYEGEYFNPKTSPNRVHKTVQRLRGWFDENNVAAQINVENYQFKMNFNASDYYLRIPINNSKPIREKQHLRALKNHFKHKAFSSSQAANLLKVSKATICRDLEYALEHSLIIRSGQGRSVLYYFEDEI